LNHRSYGYDRGSERVEGRWLTIFERIEVERYVEGYKEAVDLKDFCLRMLVYVCACVRVCMRACVCVRERKRGEKERQIREREEREECDDAKGGFKNRLDSGRGWEESTSTCTSRTAVKAQLGRVCHDRWDLG
jgi:hypothetical protein